MDNLLSKAKEALENEVDIIFGGGVEDLLKNTDIYSNTAGCDGCGSSCGGCNSCSGSCWSGANSSYIFSKYDKLLIINPSLCPVVTIIR